MTWLFVLFVLPLCLAQPPPANMDPATMAEGVDNIRRLTGIAAQIMELSGNIMGGRGGGGGGDDYGRDVRPSFHGVRNFETDNSITSGSSQDNSIRNMARLIQEYGTGFLMQATTPTTTTTTTTRPNVFQSLMNTFLGSSVDSNPDSLPPPPTPKPRQTNILGLFGNSFGGQPSAPVPAPVKESNNNFMGGIIDSFLPTTPAPTRQPSFLSMFGLPTATEKPSSSRLGKIDLFEMFGMGPRTTTTTEAPLRALLTPGSYMGGGDAQNIDKILNALVRSNAQPASRAEPGAAGLISQFFGK